MVACRQMAWLLALLVAAWPGGSHAAIGAKPPNIVFIMADDLGYGELGSYGQRKIRTPRLDHIAAQGMRFTQFYSAAPVCAPAREALLLGRHAGHVRHANQNAPMAAESVTLAELLRTQGYATAMIGKWALGNLGTGGEPDRHGFDHYFGYLDQTAAHRHYPTQLYRNGERLQYPGNALFHGDVHSGDAFVAEAQAFINRHQGQPFFLYLPLTLPHADIVAPQAFLDAYAGRFPETPFAGGHYAPQTMPNAATAAMISLLDHHVGQVLDSLAAAGLDERTIVFFTSDNGPVSVGGRNFEFFDGAGGLRGGKRSLYEGGIRVPMIVRWPGRVPAQVVSDAVWSLVDVFATVADLVAAPTGETDGTSVLPILLGEAERLARRPLYWAWRGSQLSGPPDDAESWSEPEFVQAVRLGDWKAVRFYRSSEVELYNLAEDSGETRDLAARHPRKVATLTAIMEREHAPLPVR